MNCHVCQTNLPDDAICCYKCGTSVGGEIRQVEPLPIFETEQTTFVRPQVGAVPRAVPLPGRQSPFTGFLKIALLGLLLAGGVVGFITFISSRENVATAQLPQNQTKPTMPVLNSTPTPKKTTSSTPTPTPSVSPSIVNSANRLPVNVDRPDYPPSNYSINSLPPRSQSNSQNLPAEQMQRGFDVAFQFLKNDMLSAATQKAKNKHPLSRLETCSQDVLQTFQSESRREYSGIYRCQLRGTVLGRDVFETTVNITGKTEYRYGSFFRNISGSEIGSDIKLNN